MITALIILTLYKMREVMDWTSIKLAGISVALAAINFGFIVGFFAVAASVSTILYNYYRYKQDKKKKHD